jgi:hypothetical protein
MPYRDPEKQRQYLKAWRARQRPQALPVQEQAQQLLRQAQLARTPEHLALLVRPMCRLLGQLAGVRLEE